MESIKYRPNPSVPVLMTETSKCSSTSDLAYDFRHVPVMRGKIHLFLVFISPFWVYSLLRACKSTKAIISVSVACISAISNFASSALYHNFKWNNSVTAFLQRLDHAGIFLMISGSTFPVSIHLLEGISSILIPSIQWAVSLYGILVSLGGYYTLQSSLKRTLFYIFVGCLHSFAILDLLRNMTLFEVTMTFSLSSLYIVGGAMYAIRRPNPIKNIFGYHEMFHLCCLGSAICTFLLDYSVIKRF